METPKASALPVLAVDHGPFQLAAACDDLCSAGLSLLAGERALALWNDRDGSWAQRFDLAAGSSLGPPLAIGKLTEQGELPYVFGLPDGDAAIFGVLRDGRITFARGSDVASRRVTAKVVVAAAARGVRSLAVGALPSGLLMLVLREADAKEERAERPVVDAELHWFDARGETTREAMVWGIQPAQEARVAVCGDQLYLAWDTASGVLVTRMSITGTDRAQTFLPPPATDLDANLGPFTCAERGVKLVAGWKEPQAYELLPKASVAAIGATDALPKNSSWLTLALPALPQHLPLRDYPFGAYSTPAGDWLLLKDSTDAWAFVRLDLAAGKVHGFPGTPKLPPLAPCVPSNDGERALCVTSQVTSRVPKCKTRTTRLEAAFVQRSAPAPADSGHGVAAATTGEYFTSGSASIPQPEAPSKQEAEERSTQLWCGEPGWDSLRKAVENFCVELQQRRDASTKKKSRRELDEMLDAYCGKEPGSVLYQTQNCTDKPLACGHPTVSNILMVDRAEFENGTDRLMMNVFDGNCQVWFQESGGEAGAWRLVDHECNGD